MRFKGSARNYINEIQRIMPQSRTADCLFICYCYIHIYERIYIYTVYIVYMYCLLSVHCMLVIVVALACAVNSQPNE